jgi:hypothetical protein
MAYDARVTKSSSLKCDKEPMIISVYFEHCKKLGFFMNLNTDIFRLHASFHVQLRLIICKAT